MADVSRTAKVVPLLVAVIACASPARAIDVPTVYDNYQSYPLGSRAAAMGGAYTALACDEAAVHYNPAALACAASSRIELSANAYVLQSVNAPAAFGRDQDLDATTYHSIPSIVGGARVILEGEPDGSGRVVFGLSVEVPHSIAIDADPDRPEEPSFVAFTARDDVTTGDIGVGWQITPEIAIGASIGGAIRTSNTRLALVITSIVPVACGDAGSCYPFALLSTETETLALGARGRLGVRWTPTPPLSLGLTITSPTIDLYGSSDIAILLAAAGPAGDGQGTYLPLPRRYEGSSDVSLPLRIALGGALTLEPVTLSLDASLNFPTDVDAAAELEPIVIRGYEAPTPAELSAATLTHHRDWQPNVNVGAEIVLTEDVAIGFGGFTDFSSVADEDAENPDSPDDRVHLYGASLALGLLGKQARGWFGASFSYGENETRSFSGDLEEFRYDGRAELTRWNLAGFIGSSYSFQPDPE